MNRSHKQQLERLKAQNEYDNKDLEIAEELLKQKDPAFHEEVKAVRDKIKSIINLEDEK
ncbi:MAG TPA: hypothetical protein GXZ48_00415 [Acholeplasmataceae bacterium]|nr:hypothetical protein [Acholeplasmataceae bacterium]